jgi:hypothetical protein
MFVFFSCLTLPTDEIIIAKLPIVPGFLWFNESLGTRKSLLMLTASAESGKCWEHG